MKAEAAKVAELSLASDALRERIRMMDAAALAETEAKAAGTGAAGVAGGTDDAVDGTPPLNTDAAAAADADDAAGSDTTADAVRNPGDKGQGGVTGDAGSSECVAAAAGGKGGLPSDGSIGCIVPGPPTSIVSCVVKRQLPAEKGDIGKGLWFRSPRFTYAHPMWARGLCGDGNVDATRKRGWRCPPPTPTLNDPQYRPVAVPLCRRAVTHTHTVNRCISSHLGEGCVFDTADDLARAAKMLAEAGLVQVRPDSAHSVLTARPRV